MSNSQTEMTSGTLFGHPTGLFTLFFAEMWERFSYYGMRALLVFYMIKGFLGYNDNDAYAVYGAYTALVYAAPFIGGMLADKLLGARRAVVIGGLLMAAGHLTMTVQNETVFFVALALLICGNGFFKPNISTMVGSLYPKGSAKKDAGFTIFYMGINLGAAMSPVICGYVGETYGWHYGFGLATGGMLVGVAVFVAPTWLTQLLIALGALGTAVAMPFLQDSLMQLVVRAVLAIALAIAGAIAVIALGRGGLPEETGAPPDAAALRRKLGGFLRADMAVYLGIVLAVPVVALLVQRNPIAGWALIATGAYALVYILYEAFFKSTKVERERLYVALILMFFSMLFWAFFEQAGSSVNNFTDRNIDRVLEDRQIAEAEVGSTLQLRVPPRAEDAEVAALPLLSQEHLGYRGNDEIFGRVDAANAREEAEDAQQEEQQDAEGGPENVADGAADQPSGPPVVVSVSPSDVAEDAAPGVTYTFSRSGPATAPLTVSFGVAGSAKFDDDYTRTGAASFEAAAGTVTIPAGETSATVTLQPVADALVEADETVVLTVVPGTGYVPGDPDAAAATINDNGFTITHLAVLRDEAAREEATADDMTVSWTVTDEQVGMGVGGAEIPASEFQAANPIFILVFGLVFTALWSFLATRGLEPSTPVKFALGLLQLGLAFGTFWYGAQMADERGMVAISWLLLGYLLQTTGELCLSPVGLSMVTKLSPARIVSTIMGAWFLATAFSNYLAGIIATFTGVSHGGEGDQVIPPPTETVHLYGDVFGKIALTAIGSALVCFVLAPLLSRWMHEGVDIHGQPVAKNEA